MGVGVEFSASYFGVGVVILLQGIEYLWQIQAKLSFLWIIAHNIGAADIGLPLIEHRAEVEKDGVVFGDFVNRGFSAKMRTVLGPARTIRLCQYCLTPNDCSARV
jgi:hypothetical protein